AVAYAGEEVLGPGGAQMVHPEDSAMLIAREGRRRADLPVVLYLVQIAALVKAVPANVQGDLICAVGRASDELEVGAELVGSKATNALLPEGETPEARAFLARAATFVVGRRFQPSVENGIEVHAVPVVEDLDAGGLRIARVEKAQLDVVSVCVIGVLHELD